MAVSHRTNRLKVIGNPSVEKLQNDRFRLTFNMSPLNPRNDWYNDNKGRIFAEFGTLESAAMSVDGIDARFGEAYSDMRLVAVEAGNRGSVEGGDYIVQFVYETIGNTFVQVKDDTIDYELNGLRRVTRESIAKAGTDFQKTVGTTSISSQIDDETAVTCILASYEVDDTDSYRKVTETYIEAGTISRTEDFVGSQDSLVLETIGADPSPPAGFSLASKQESNFQGYQTNRFTFLKDNVVLSRTITERNSGTSTTGKIRTEVVEVFNGTPTSDIGGVKIGDEESNVDGIPTRRYTFVSGNGEIRTSTRPGPVNIPGTQYVTVESVGTAVTPTGTLVSESEDNENGYIKYVKTALQGTITGTKQTYKDVVEVEVPGTVNCTTVGVSAGGESGTIAIPQVTPAKTKRVGATVTVEVTDDPPDTASLAYDIGEISCSVTSTNVQLSEGPGVTVSAGTTGVVTETGYVKNFSASSRIQTYPGCYLTSSSSTGSISYTSSSTPKVNNNVITSDTATATRQTKCIGTGASEATGYATTGIIKRQSRPILTTLDGTTYYEVITWSV